MNVLCEKVALFTNKPKDHYKKLISFVKNRPGHDRRYAINCNKIKTELGWSQSVTFDEGLNITIKWYLENKKWVENVKNGSYRRWIDLN